MIDDQQATTNDQYRQAVINDSLRRSSFVVRRLTLDTIWLLVVPVALLCYLNLATKVYPNDFWWHVRTGQIILEEGHIPTLDRFSFTCFGKTWINQAWAMQVVLYLVYRVGGVPLLILAHALIITTGYTFLLHAARRYYGLRIGVLATLIGTAVGVLNWVPRPQVLSFLFFGLLVYLIEGHRHGRTRQLWWVVPLFVVWVNSHGGFVFGIGVLGLYVTGRLWEFGWAGMPAQERRDTLQLVGIGLLSLVALVLNPQGPVGIVQYVLGFLQSSATTRYNLEFMALSIRELDGALFFASSLFLVVAMVWSGFRPRADHALNVVVFGAMALLARRNAPWYGFVLAPVLAAALRAWWNRPRTAYAGKLLLNGIIVGAMSLGLLVTLPWWRGALLRERGKLVTDTTPVAGTEYLCAALPDDARVYQYLGFSSYQIWACPRLPVFMDARFELYPLDQWLDYMAIEKARFDWEALLSKYGVTHLFLSPEFQEHVVGAAGAAECWREIYRDDEAVIFERSCLERN